MKIRAQQNMTQDELNIVGSIAMRIHKDPWFKKRKRTDDEVQDWIRYQLASLGNYTVPVENTAFTKCNEKTYKKYAFLLAREQAKASKKEKGFIAWLKNIVKIIKNKFSYERK
jgi:hypothetical protein